MMNPDTKSPRASEIATIKEVAVVDDSRQAGCSRIPMLRLLAQLTDRAGMIISPAAVENTAKTWPATAVGTGPFQFVEWVKDDH